MGAVILGLMLGGFLLSLVLTAVIKKVAVRVGFVDKPGHRKIHYIPKPLGGGVAIFLALAIPMIGGLIVVHFGNPPVGDPLAIHWPGIRHQTPLAIKFLAAMLAMHVLGLWDDRRALGPYVKLLIQLAIIAGLVLWADLRALTVLDNLGMGKWSSVILTVL